MPPPKSKGKSSKRKPPAEQAGEPTVNGVLVQFEPGGDGERNLSIQPLGDVKQTELPTVLGLARKVVENQLGIGGG